MEAAERAMDPYSHDPFSPASEDGSHGRQENRDSLFLMAEMRLDGASRVLSVRVRNLSAGGLMAEYREPIAQGRRVEFQLRGVGTVPGHVAWSAAGRIGVAFDVQIDPMLARKPVGQSGNTPGYVKPILARGTR